MASIAAGQTAQILWTPTQRLGASSSSRRAGVACAFCRARKVKCNRIDDQACTNCVFENVQCVLLPKQRPHRKARKSSKLPQLGAPESPMQSFTVPNERSTNPNPTEIHTQSAVPPFYNSPDQHRREPETTSEGSAPADDGFQSSQDVDNSINWREAAIEAIPTRAPDRSVSPLFSTSSLSGSKEFLTPSVPSFLKPPPACLGEEDIDYLGRKGALSIPEPELRDALIESYVHFIHPCYPIIELDTLEDALLGNSRQTFSLSVFQAILFAGSSWVDVKLLRKLGYLSRWAARKALYAKARLLYDADYEQDRLCQLQTLVLLSLWWTTPIESKDGWHWLGLAISLARTMGLHQDATNKHLDARTSALRRRIWWSCIIRDTFTSFSCNRVPRISDADFVVAPLTLNDFEWRLLPDANRKGFISQNLDIQKQMAAICIQTAAICRIITRVLFAAYKETSTGNIDILYFNSTPAQGRSYIEPTKLKAIEEEFQAWKIGLPPDAAYKGSTSAPSSRHEQASLVHRALLSILYHAGLIMIHRQRDPGLPFDESPRDLVRDAARQVNKVIMDMYAHDLMKDMSPTVISVMFPASVSHILDMKSQDSSLRREGVQRLNECKQALLELADGHLSAEWAVNFLKDVESKVIAQHQVTKALSATVNTQTLLNPEGNPSRDPNPIGRRQNRDQGRISAQCPPTAYCSGDDASTSHIQSTQPNPMLNPGDAIVTENPLDWIGSPNIWFSFPQAQWDTPSMDRLEHSTMLMDFGGDNFTE